MSTTVQDSLGRWRVRAITAAAAATFMAASLAAAPPATAATVERPSFERSSENVRITAAELHQGIADIKAAGIPYEVFVREDGTDFIVFHFAEGDLGLNIPEKADATVTSPGVFTPKFAVGSDGEGNYISFNHTDQVAIRNGTTAALVAAIAIISPPVGVIAGILVAWAGTYTADNGNCPGNDELWVYYSQGIDGNPLYEKIVCRPVSYPGGG